jgi:hypothetical protein
MMVALFLLDIFRNLKYDSLLSPLSLLAHQYDLFLLIPREAPQRIVLQNIIGSVDGGVEERCLDSGALREAVF